MTTPSAAPDFSGLGLPPFLLQTIVAVGYETPSPIQAQSIPVLLSGRDLLGQAQTGTGKTAAFALPALARLDLKDRQTQVLILTPTRELAIQVAEACQTYARGMGGFAVVPIYGGTGYSNQLKQLKGGAQLVVGTPGRVMDHIRRKSLRLDKLKTLVLDEADEMLRMGFIDDVEWILEHTPAERQTALFSATMPKQIQQVSKRYMRDPHTIKIPAKTSTAEAINQRYWPVSGLHKLDALTRILEAEPIDAAIIFVRTKTATVELSEKLAARGFAVDALNGDIPQVQREKVVNKMRRGKLDILVATDVAARGIDIPRISHVINYDIPFDTEAYVHRIGRTGRAGRTGEAILFVANRERRMLKAIERATKQPIAVMNLPSEQDINQHRVEKFKANIARVLQNDDLSLYRKILEEFREETQITDIEMAAALAKMAQGDVPLLLSERERKTRDKPAFDDGAGDKRISAKGKQKKKRQSLEQHLQEIQAKPLKKFPEIPMERFRLAVGYADEVRPGHIVGAIANEADIGSDYIGHIEIYDDFSTVDLPADMPPETFAHLKTVWVCQRQLAISRLGDKPPRGKSKRPAAKKSRNPDRKKAGRKGKANSKH